MLWLCSEHAQVGKLCGGWARIFPHEGKGLQHVQAWPDVKFITE